MDIFFFNLLLIYASLCFALKYTVPKVFVVQYFMHRHKITLRGRKVADCYFMVQHQTKPRTCVMYFILTKFQSVFYWIDFIAKCHKTQSLYKLHHSFSKTDCVQWRYTVLSNHNLICQIPLVLLHLPKGFL